MPNFSSSESSFFSIPSVSAMSFSFKRKQCEINVVSLVLSYCSVTFKRFILILLSLVSAFPKS